MLRSLSSGLVARDAGKRNIVRRKRFQRGSLTIRKRKGKNYWFAQWREEGKPRTKELGLCSKVSRVTAESMLQEILKPINDGIEKRELFDVRFGQFVESVYLPVYERKWKGSTASTEIHRLRFHLIRALVLQLQLISRTDYGVGNGKTAPELDVCTATRTKPVQATVPPFSATRGTTADAESPARSEQPAPGDLCGEFSLFRRFSDHLRPHHGAIGMDQPRERDMPVPARPVPHFVLI